VSEPAEHLPLGDVEQFDFCQTGTSNLPRDSHGQQETKENYPYVPGRKTNEVTITDDLRMKMTEIKLNDKTTIKHEI
jgi:hypothetical protein